MILEYKGYIARASYDAFAQLFQAETLNTPERLTLEAGSKEELKDLLRLAVDESLGVRSGSSERPI